jgi:hypothetical protein
MSSDEPHMGPALHLIARLYAVEERAKTLSLSADERLALRRCVSARLLQQLHRYLLELQAGVPAEESGWGRCTLRVEPVEGVDAILGGRRVGDDCRCAVREVGHPSFVSSVRVVSRMISSVHFGSYSPA